MAITIPAIIASDGLFTAYDGVSAGIGLGTKRQGVGGVSG